jgi:hypothetical protein
VSKKERKLLVFSVQFSGKRERREDEDHEPGGSCYASLRDKVPAVATW